MNQAQQKRGLVVIKGGKVATEEPREEAGKCMTFDEMHQARVRSGQVIVQYPEQQKNIFGRPYC